MEIVFLFLLALTIQVMSDTSFKPDIDIDGHPLCSSDPPSANVSLTQPSSPYPIPLCVLCGWQCKKTPNCTGFNLKCDNRTCELYSYQPTTFQHSSDCSFYSTSKNTEASTAVEREKSTESSFSTTTTDVGTPCHSSTAATTIIPPATVSTPINTSNSINTKFPSTTVTPTTATIPFTTSPFKTITLLTTTSITTTNYITASVFNTTSFTTPIPVLTTTSTETAMTTTTTTPVMTTTITTTISALPNTISKAISTIGTGERFVITVDNDLYELYFDGVLQTNLPNRDNWQKTDNLNLPWNTTVIAVKAVNHGGPAGILASTSDGFILTNSTWKCSNTSTSSWKDVAFDDSTWMPAVEFGFNGFTSTLIWGYLPNIESNAAWIWNSRNLTDLTIFCRLNLH